MKLPPQLVPPAALLARVRWLFRGFWMLFWGALAVHIVVGQTFWVAGLAGMVALAAWWLRCCAQDRFPLWALTFEVPLLLVVGVATPDPLELVYSVIPFRAVYSRSFREVLTTSAAVVAVVVGVSLFAPAATGAAAIASEANSIVGTVGFACILYLATRAMAAAERSAVRERVVARAVLAFGTVRHREDLATVVAEAATALFADLDPDHAEHRVEVTSLELTDQERGSETTPTTTSLSLGGGADDHLRLLIEGGTPAAHQENSDSLNLLAHGASLALRQLSLQEILEARAAEDSLTGAVNRRSFMERVAAVKIEADAGTVSLWLLFLDIDDFKGVNDTRGHHVGDAVLVAFAERMRARLGERDVVARLGGDEFALLLIGQPEDAQLGNIVASRIQAELRQPVEVPRGEPVTASASIGVVRWEPGMELADLMRVADRAMYRQKRSHAEL